MHHNDTFIIAPDTFDLLKKLQAIHALNDFYLVVGTALALQLGHRTSIDIDLFTQKEFNNEEIIETVSSQFDFNIRYTSKNTIIGLINDVKVDFITHGYDLVLPEISEEGITFLSMEDIAAMKLHAISNSGKRLKDFIDIYFLLEHFSLTDILGFYTVKYKKFNPLIALKAINYFGDIDPTMDPPKLKTTLPLTKIKKRINDAVLHSKKIFS